MFLRNFAYTPKVHTPESGIWQFAGGNIVGTFWDMLGPIFESQFCPCPSKKDRWPPCWHTCFSWIRLKAATSQWLDVFFWNTSRFLLNPGPSSKTAATPLVALWLAGCWQQNVSIPAERRRDAQLAHWHLLGFTTIQQQPVVAQLAWLIPSNTHVYECIWYISIYIYIIEGSLEVKLPTIWTVEKQRWEESEEKRSEERRCRCAKR